MCFYYSLLMDHYVCWMRASYIQFTNIFSQCVACLFICWIAPSKTNFLKIWWYRIDLSLPPLADHTFGVVLTHPFHNSRSWKFSPFYKKFYSFSSNILVYNLFWVNFLHSVRKRSNFILLNVDINFFQYHLLKRPFFLHLNLGILV